MENLLFMKRLKELREMNGLSQEQLSERTGINRSAISKYETGIRLPTINAIIKLSCFFKVSINYLCGLEDYLSVVLPKDDVITYRKVIALIESVSKNE